MKNSASKILIALSILMSITISQFSIAQQLPSIGNLGEVLAIDTRTLTHDEYRLVTEMLDSMGAIPMTRLSDRSTIGIRPGSMTPEQGLDFIPDDDEAIDIYLSLLEDGALPFSATFLTNQVLFDDGSH